MSAGDSRKRHHALAGWVVVETAERPAGEYAGKLLADFGAELIKVERPGGAPTRGWGTAVFRYLNTNKKSVVLDLAGAEDRALLEKLLARADALIDDHPPAWGRAHGLAPGDYPGLVHCAITPFGQSAPETWQILRSLNVANAGGWAWHTPSETGPDRPPLQGAGRFMSDYEAGLEAALCLAASLLRRRRTGQGQFIDISEVAVQLSRCDGVLGRHLAGEVEPSHARTAYDMGGPGATFACADGHLQLIMTSRPHWLGLRRLLGEPEWAASWPEDWLEFHCTPERVAAFRAHFAAWAATQEKAPVSAQALRLGVPLAQVNTAADLMEHPQYRHRGFFRQMEGVAYPTVPYRLSASPARLIAPAPALGQHQGDLA